MSFLVYYRSDLRGGRSAALFLFKALAIQGIS